MLIVSRNVAFSDFEYGFRSSGSTADNLTVVSDWIVQAFKRSAATRVAAIGISQTFEGFGMLVFFTNLSGMKFLVRYLALFCLFSVIDRFEWFLMGSLCKNIGIILVFLNDNSVGKSFQVHTKSCGIPYCCDGPSLLCSW